MWYAAVSKFKRLSTSPSDCVGIWKSRRTFWSKQIAKEALARLNYWVRIYDVFPRPVSAWISNAPSGQEHVKRSECGFYEAEGIWDVGFGDLASIYQCLFRKKKVDIMTIIRIITWQESPIGCCFNSWAVEGRHGAVRLLHDWMYGKSFKWENFLCSYESMGAFYMYRIVEFNWKKLYFPPQKCNLCPDFYFSGTADEEHWVLDIAMWKI